MRTCYLWLQAQASPRHLLVRFGAELGIASPTAQQASGRKRHLNDSQEALKRQRALQEKSKRAQKRYRERKKACSLGLLADASLSVTDS